MAITNASLSAARFGFRAATRIRGGPDKRIFHPRGEGFTGRATLFAPARLHRAGEANEFRCIARLSRAVGLPDGIPDALGLAIRIASGRDVWRA
ncbi:hypothetical protein ONR57_19705 [Hoyosella sp. YIM 151337]|uniref:hypothetical protein n=1 Tax=Hoyosella sp. YIM 151337 TaxID=2992742 RepID=UPI0022356CA6|nr:hypothetical protein [Hoyosella sp. YIM 151337]MCW4355534.1 hypothetical protein [Hoyosella sp. YIM 151337]